MDKQYEELMDHMKQGGIVAVNNFKRKPNKVDSEILYCEVKPNGQGTFTSKQIESLLIEKICFKFDRTTLLSQELRARTLLNSFSSTDKKVVLFINNNKNLSERMYKYVKSLYETVMSRTESQICIIFNHDNTENKLPLQLQFRSTQLNF